jgi:hypothetical protein
MHIYMEISQGNSLCTILNQQKCHFYFFYKIKEQKGRTGLIRGVGTSGKGEEEGKGCWRVNIMQILYTHVCKLKNDTYWNQFRHGANEG